MSETINWKNPASGDWNAGTNWGGGAVPASTDNAAIGLAGSYDVTIGAGETEAIVSVSITNAAATLLLDGLLALGGTLSGTGPVVLSGGTIAGGTIASGADLDFAQAYNYLAGVTVDGGLQVGGPLSPGVVVLTAATTVYAEGGVSPGTITLGDNTGTTTNFGDIYFQNTRTIENFITAGGSSETLYVDAGGTLSGGIYPVATLTLGTQFVLQGGTNDTFTLRDNGAAVGYADLVNQGTINAGATGDVVYISTQGFTNAALMEATAGGDVLQIENSSANAWSNTGTISVSGGGNAYLGGSILAVGTLVHNGTGEIYITGTVENAGSTQDAAGSLNGVVFQGGTILGGTVLHGADLDFSQTYNYLAGVSVDGGLQVGGPLSPGVVVLTATTTVDAADGVSPGTVTLGDNTGTTTNSGDIYFQNTRTIENFITAGGSNEALYIDAGGTYSGGGYPLATLTLGSQFVLQGGTNDSFTFRDNGAAVGYADLVNQGTINAGATGDVVYLQTHGFTNAGLMEANAAGDVLQIENNSADAWSNTGTISVSGGGNAYLGGSILAVGTLVHSGTGEIYITGTVENAGSTQDAAGSLNGVVFQGGTILGGTVLHGADLDFSQTYNYLAGVTVDGGLQVGGPLSPGVVVLTATTTVYAADGVSPGTITLGDNTGTTTNSGDIYFQNTRTIENFITAGGSNEALYIDAGGTYSGGGYPLATLTLGTQFVLQGSTNDSFTFRDNGAAVGYADLVNQGTINAGATGDVVYINTHGFTNAGLMEANAAGDVLQIENNSADAWSNTGTISVSGGGNAYLGGSILAVGTLVHTGTGEIYITGTVENAGSTQDAAGSLNGVVFQGGTILGGTVLHGADLDFSQTYNYLTGVSVDGGLQVGGPLNPGVVVLTSTTTVYAADGVSPGTITLGDNTGTTTNSGDIYFQNTRTIENFITAGGSNEALYIDAGGTYSGGGYPLATLTLGTQFVLQGGTNDSFTFRDNGAAVGYADLVNQGTINAGVTGDTLHIETQGFTNAGLVAGSGVINVLVNDGVVESTGALRIGGAVTGTGTLEIDSGDALELAAATSGGQSVQFGGPGTLRLDAPTLFDGTLLDLQGGDTIDLTGTIAIGATINGALLAITLQPSVTLDLALIDPASGITAAIADGGTEVVITGVTCFRAGTRIATPRGEVAVEDLAPGDEVLTIDGTAQPVQWVGQREVNCARHPQPWQVWPVRIAAHAFGRDCPRRPLYLSPDHAVFVEDVLIPAKHLISGATVRQVRVDRAHYYHIELPRHAVVLAEGLPAESYLHTGDRRSFANDTVVALHPAWGSAARDPASIFDALGAAPLQVSGPAVERALARLAIRNMRPRSYPTRRAGRTVTSDRV